ncbi:integrase [Burkholderia lata]|uniref:Integrase n=1 Tax=Burkholderia lata (strain ATCC 17760 / DSM 23089 / LMG 22485 / NCIMB 9086 / R18194 / 383) TaxID=482957 RepID=A0A6P2YAL5_BURL3|nr:integrase [Burkholderia lata]
MRVIKRVSLQSAGDDTHFFTVSLDAIKIRQATAGDKPTKLADFNGLDLLIKPSGSRLWQYKYRIAGKENLFAIGECRSISLQGARAARDGARELVKKGLHPSHARQEVLSARIDEGKATFRAVCDEWLEKKRKTWTERHFGEILRMHRNRCLPVHREPSLTLSYRPRCACFDAPGRRAGLPFRSNQTASVRVQRVPVCGDHAAGRHRPRVGAAGIGSEAADRECSAAGPRRTKTLF